MEDTLNQNEFDPTRIEIDVDDRSLWMSGYLNHSGAHFKVPYATHLHGNLWQGGCWQGLVLPEHFKHVISLYPWESYQINHDATRDEIWVYDATTGFEPEIYVDAAMKTLEYLEDGPTLVHCQAGINRSSLVSGLALIISGVVKSGDAAVELIREKRSPVALSNPVFERYLRDFGSAFEAAGGTVEQ